MSLHEPPIVPPPSGGQGRGIGRIAAATVAALVCAACFEPPIDERLSLEFREDGSAEIEVTVEFLDGSGGAGKTALAERLAERRRALLEGRDDWTRRFARLEPVSERSGWEKEDGDLRRFTRAAVLDDPQRGLRRFFSDTAVTVFHERGDRSTELALYPGNATRADRRQREIVRRELNRYGEHVASYLAAAAALWDYLDKQPERARVCLGDLFGDLVPEEIREGLDEPDEFEQELLEELEEAMEPVAGILEVGDEEAYSLDELSRFVFDPFPAEIRVHVPGRIELLEGFEQRGEGRLRIRPSGFWEAFLSLDGRWLTPDPLVAFVEASRNADDQPFDLDGFVARERRVEGTPSDAEVHDALVKRLRPAAAYRVVWQRGASKASGEAESVGAATPAP